MTLFVALLNSQNYLLAKTNWNSIELLSFTAFYFSLLDLKNLNYINLLTPSEYAGL